jgi:hypothetical protein
MILLFTFLIDVDLKGTDIGRIRVQVYGSRSHMVHRRNSSVSLVLFCRNSLFNDTDKQLYEQVSDSRSQLLSGDKFVKIVCKKEAFVSGYNGDNATTAIISVSQSSSRGNQWSVLCGLN